MNSTLLSRIIIVILISTSFVFFTNSCSNQKSPAENLEEIKEEYVPQMAYGIVIDSLMAYKDKVKKNQFLAASGSPPRRIARQANNRWCNGLRSTSGSQDSIAGSTSGDGTQKTYTNTGGGTPLYLVPRVRLDE